MFQEYLLTYHKKELTKILTSAPEETKHLSLNISFVNLFENDPKVGNRVLKEGENVLESMDEALVNVQKILAVNLNTTEILEKVVHTRVYGLPSCHEQHRSSIPRSVDLHSFLQITGSVVRTTLVKMLEFRRIYKCSKCNYQMTSNAVYEQKYVIFPPKKCLNPEGCGNSNITALKDLDASNCKDYQEIKIQEQISKSSLGSMPGSLWITLEDDLVDICKPGDTITVCGILKCRWGPLIPNKRINSELVLKANHLQVNNAQCSSIRISPDIKNFFNSFWKKYRNQPLVGRDIIIKSICPLLYGLHTVKLAVGMVLASGSRTQNTQETGIRARSESHLLLVGDPGTGKSQILKFAAKIIPRSVLTTGVGSTSAGLTVTAIQENGEWQLEGGALVRADGGICCIDEFNSMKERDRTSIHEAMEQQTISVAKASIVCKLSTRCSILAAINPKGNFDLGQPLSVNVGVPSPLLSRFDIILILRDTKDSEWDNAVCDYTLDRSRKKGKNDPGIWEIDLLRAYFSYIKDIQPNLTPEANRILGNYYQAQRRSFAKNRVTVRLLDSLVRLSKAHARLMFHDEVHVMDAVNAVIMMESSMHGVILGLNVNSSRSLFPKDPMLSYTQLARSILEKLELADILNDELTRLEKLAEQRAAEDDHSMSFERENKDNSRLLSRLNISHEKIKRNDPKQDTKDDVSENNKVTVTNKEANYESDEENRKKNNKNDLFEFKTADVEKDNLLKKNVNKNNTDTKEDTRDTENKDKVKSTKDFLSKFKFTKTERKEVENKSISTITESNNLQDKSNTTNSEDKKDEETNKENDNKENHKGKRKRNVDEFGKIDKKKKAKGKRFDSEVEIDIEKDIDWNLGETTDKKEEKNSEIMPQSSSRGLFEFEDDEVVDWDI